MTNDSQKLLPSMVSTCLKQFPHTISVYGEWVKKYQHNNLVYVPVICATMHMGEFEHFDAFPKMLSSFLSPVSCCWDRYFFSKSFHPLRYVSSISIQFICQNLICKQAFGRIVKLGISAVVDKIGKKRKQCLKLQWISRLTLHVGHVTKAYINFTLWI